MHKKAAYSRFFFAQKKTILNKWKTKISL
jgi:hypothetical protein